MKYLLSILLFLLLSPLVYAESRTALVIGNSDYKLMPLKNPKNDAEDIAAKLETLGFQVTLGTNKSKTEVKRLIREFSQSLRQRGGVGFFFYAGHGIQVDGKNYLVPVDFDAQAAYEVADASVDASLVTMAMEEAGADVNIVVLDACRDNPFPRKTRSGSRGLARINRRINGTLIAYSTSPGDVAADGDRRNSPYTENLLKYIGIPGLTVEDVFKKVRIGVGESTNGQQQPWELSSITRDFYFVPGDASSSLAAPVAVYHPPPRPEPVSRPPPPPVDVVPSNAKKLSIFTNPEDSKVTLLNSSTPYSMGVKLEPGDYRVEVSKEGYITKKKWVNIDTEDLMLQITLVPDY